jgi:thiosulfate dehydrogenase
MSSRLGWFILGILTALVGTVAGGYLFVKAGGVPMETTAPPLPLERTVARLALHASFGNAADTKDPLPVNDDNLVAGAQEYKEHCAVCHGAPSRPRTTISRGMFPQPPQLFEKTDMVTRDPEGITYWKVTHGIRLSGMPGFGAVLSDTQRWQVVMLVSRADKLPPAVRAEITSVLSHADTRRLEGRAPSAVSSPRR